MQPLPRFQYSRRPVPDLPTLRTGNDWVAQDIGETDLAGLDSAFVAAHRGNISRYSRLLRTPLTDLERHFVERRLAEERAALGHRLTTCQPRPVSEGRVESVARERATR